MNGYERSRAIRNSSIEGIKKLILYTLDTFGGTEDLSERWAHPGTRKLATSSGLHRTTLMRHLGDLVSEGNIDTRPKPPQSREYRIRFDRLQRATGSGERPVAESDHHRSHRATTTGSGERPEEDHRRRPVKKTTIQRIDPAKKKAKDEAFEIFWKRYPRKVGKQAARKAFDKHVDGQTMHKIMAALEWQTQTDNWMKEGGSFVPHPSTYLNQHRWLDESE